MSFLELTKLWSDLYERTLHMPRRARVLIPGAPLHLIQRGNNRSVCFFSDDDYLFYMELLAEQASKSGCEIHAWCLMSNHVHLLVSPQE
ncbi:transposase [Pseudomonas sp. H1_F01]